MATCELINANSLEYLKTLADNSVDTFVTDPPYGLSDFKATDVKRCLAKWIANEPFQFGKPGFLGRDWDSWVPGPELWCEVYRVLKPGGYLAAFSGSRTLDLMSMAIRLSGFDVRDILVWFFSSGMLHAKMLRAGEIGEEIGEFDGWASTLKPAHEPIVLARKPLEASLEENLKRYGTGALNIDGCRVPVPQSALEIAPRGPQPLTLGFLPETPPDPQQEALIAQDKRLGRIPSNVLIQHAPTCTCEERDGVMEWECDPESDCPAPVMNLQGGERRGAKRSVKTRGNGGLSSFGYESRTTKPYTAVIGFGDAGGATRYFPQLGWQAEKALAPFLFASKSTGNERKMGLERNPHPTVKPISVMRWLIQLLVPPGGLVIDPFMGSGSTALAAWDLDVDFKGIELSPEYHAAASERLRHWKALTSDKKAQGKLF
jgi:site-specific DNA-methyltransferase (adenine-specific)